MRQLLCLKLLIHDTFNYYQKYPKFCQTKTQDNEKSVDPNLYLKIFYHKRADKISRYFSVEANLYEMYHQ